MYSPVLVALTSYLFWFNGNAIYCWTANGCVDLDELTFDKVMKRFSYSLVKFDVAFPFGEKHEAFAKLAEETVRSVEDLLFALVGIRDYGEKTNSDLGKRFEVMEPYPVIKLFRNNSLTASTNFPHNLEINLDNLREFLKNNVNKYLGLPGCIEKLDVYASKFARAGKNAEQQLKIIREVELLEQQYIEQNRSFKVYVAIMHKIHKSDKLPGMVIANERRRITNLLDKKISKPKKAELNARLNIMRSFDGNNEWKLNNRDEL